MRFTDEMLVDLARNTTAAEKDNAAVVLPLIYDLQEARAEIAKLNGLAGFDFEKFRKEWNSAYAGPVLLEKGIQFKRIVDGIEDPDK